MHMMQQMTTELTEVYDPRDETFPGELSVALELEETRQGWDS